MVMFHSFLYVYQRVYQTYQEPLEIQKLRTQPCVIACSLMFRWCSHVFITTVFAASRLMIPMPKPCFFGDALLARRAFPGSHPSDVCLEVTWAFAMRSPLATSNRTAASSAGILLEVFCNWRRITHCSLVDLWKVNQMSRYGNFMHFLDL